MDRGDIDLEDVIKEHRRDAGRSGEEIERLTVDDSLSDLDRTKLFLSPGAHQLQQNCALERLPKVFQEYKQAAYRALFPGFTTWIESYNSQSQVAAGEAFMAILKDTSLPKEVGLWLLPTTLSMLSTNRNQDVARVWLKCLCGIVPTLPRKVVFDELMHIALSKGESQQSVQARTACCAILGSIAPLLKREEIEKYFLQKAMGLCQDTDLEVRVCMCEQLNHIARAVGLDTTKEKVLPELYELLRDEELTVQNAAFASLVQMLDYLPPEIRQTKIMPFLRLFCPPNESCLLITLPRLIGELMCKMVFDLTDDEFQPLMEAYKTYARHSSEEVRKLCASNFPAVLKAIGARKYALSLHVLYQQLVQDASSSVRAACATSFNEVAKLLGKKRTSSYLKDPLVLLLEDSSHDVLKSILEDLHLILGHFAVGTPQQKAATFGGLMPSLLLAEKSASTGRQWRLQLCLLRAFAEMPEYFTSDQIFENFVPICFCYMTDGVMPVKAAATMALANFIRNNRKASQRYELSTRVVKEYAHGRSYWSRMVFIEFCENMLKVSSSRMFKDVFLDPAISSLQDPVPSVRMRACLLLPHLKHAIKLPEDVGVLEKINHLTTQRLNDNVKEVSAAAQRVADGFKHSLRNAYNDREVASDHAISQEEIERIDKQREDEEWNILSKEEQVSMQGHFAWVLMRGRLLLKDEKKKIDDMLQRLKLEAASKKGSIASANTIQSLSSSPQDSGRLSKSIGSVRTSVSNGSRVSISSASSRAGSMDTVRKVSSSSPVPSSQIAPPGLSSKRSSGQSSMVTPGGKAGTRVSLGSGNQTAGSARPASPAVNLRPQTPSPIQDASDPSASSPSVILRKNSKTIASRRTSS
ncbi:serine/threonine-protein phosphatase 4 regulatory subunit 4 [Marchantia polymorpha subsp. ruderalis]